MIVDNGKEEAVFRKPVSSKWNPGEQATDENMIKVRIPSVDVLLGLIFYKTRAGMNINFEIGKLANYLLKYLGIY